MKKIMIRALIALAITLCAAFAAAQPIPEKPPPVQDGQIDNLDGQVIPPVQGGAGDQLRDLEVQQKLDRIQELEQQAARAKDGIRFKTAPEDRGRLIDEAAACRAQAGQLRQELSALRGRQSRLANKVKNLNGRMGKLKESDAVQNDLLLGKKGQDGKRSGGLVKFSNDTTAALAGDDKLFGTADDVVTKVANDLEETNNNLYGYTKNGKYYPGVYEVVMGKEGKGGLARGFAELKDQIAGAASANAVWLLGIVFGVGFAFLAWKLAGLARWGRGISDAVHDISQDLYGPGGLLAHLATPAPGPVPAATPPTPTPTPAPTPTPGPAPAPAPTPTPAPAPTGPVIAAINPNQGAEGDVVVIQGTFNGTFDPANAVKFVDNGSMTVYDTAITNQTPTEITVAVPSVSGVTGSFTVSVTDTFGNSTTHTFTVV